MLVVYSSTPVFFPSTKQRMSIPTLILLPMRNYELNTNLQKVSFLPSEKWRMRASAAFAEGFENFSLLELGFRIPLNPPFPKGEEMHS